MPVVPQAAIAKAIAHLTETEAKPRRRPQLLVAAALFCLPLIYFHPAVLGQITLLPGDGWSQIFGIRVLIGQMLQHGQLPLWNPYIFAGMPLLASIQPGALYPPTWFFAVLAPQAAMNLMVLTTYYLALIGTYLFARRIGCNRLGALLAGMAFTFGGYMIAHLGHTNRVAAAAWLPWILLAVEALHQQVRWRWVCLGALFIAMQFFAGEPQMTLYTALLAGAYSLFSLKRIERRERRFALLGALLAMAVGGALLSLVLLLPEREFLAYGERARIDYEYFSQYSFPPRQLFGLFFPYFFGGAAMPPYYVTYWGQWNSPETAGYVGMVTWLLALAAIFGKTLRWTQTGFWALCALLALLLAFGGNLPLELNRALFKVPIYNLFRAQGRHLLEFTFALSLLAGLGATALATLERQAMRRALLFASLLLGVIVIVCGLAYGFFDEKLVTGLPLPPNAGSFANAEFFLPVSFFLLALVAVWSYWRNGKWSGVALGAVLLADALAWGFFYEWRLPDFNLAERLSDPPAVKFIKEREPKLDEFRILSQTAKPTPANYRPLNYPNVSIVRGLQSVNGYDPLRFARLSEVTGFMTLDGVVTEPAAFTADHHGFDLLNVKYLLREKTAETAPRTMAELAGIQFADPPINLVFSAGARAQIAAPATATELAIISTMGNSDHVPDGQPVLRLKLHTTDGRVIEQEIQAGRDTSEWAYDRADVKARVQHKRAEVAESWPAGEFQGHNYLAHLRFDRAEIASIEWQHNAGAADITVSKASLYDAQTNTATPLSQFDLPPTRWRKLQQFDEVELYENQRQLPRAWFVRRWQVLKKDEILAAIKTGLLPDGTPFKPRETALIEQEWYGPRAAELPAIGEPQEAAVNLLHTEPNRLELETRNGQPGLLVLSEIYYRGWEAWIDGQRVPVEHVNYLLRGLAVPAGTHRIEFIFRAPSFRRGALFSALGVAFLLAGAVVSIRRKAW